jgi:hypothetical protein
MNRKPSRSSSPIKLSKLYFLSAGLAAGVGAQVIGSGCLASGQ